MNKQKKTRQEKLADNKGFPKDCQLDFDSALKSPVFEENNQRQI
jgi:hypothetical protein